MLPGNLPSTTPKPGVFLSPDIDQLYWLVDYERGGVAINDGSQGLDVQDWQASMQGDTIMVGPVGGPMTAMLERPGVQVLGLAFDQNMRPALTYYTAANGTRLWWFDTLAGQMVETAIPGATYPRLCLDDKRELQTSSSDVVLAYMKDGNVYYRQQRDRFQTERLLVSDAPGRLRRIGMSTVGRLQLELS